MKTYNQLTKVTQKTSFHSFLKRLSFLAKENRMAKQAQDRKDNDACEFNIRI